MNSNELFEAIQILINKSLENQAYTKTEHCEIIEVVDATKGEYIVSTGAIQFTAFGAQTYSVGDLVQVNIPNNDYEAEKLIIGFDGSYKNKIDQLESPSSSVLFTGNNLFQGLTEEQLARFQNGLIANKTTDKEITESIIFANPIKPGGRLAFGADVKSILGAYHTVIGDYGFKITLYKTNTDNAYQVIKEYLFQSSEMMGNVYNSSSFFRQEKVFDTTDIVDEITKIDLTFYETPDTFYNDKGELIPVVSSPNLFAENFFLYTGEDIVSNGTDKVVLINDNDDNSLVYDYPDDKINLSLNWKHIQDNKIITLNKNENPLPEIDVKYLIYWYRQTDNTSPSTAVDEYCSAGWEDAELRPNESEDTEPKPDEAESTEAEEPKTVDHPYSFSYNSVDGRFQDEYGTPIGHNNSFTFTDDTQNVNHMSYKAIIFTSDGKQYSTNVITFSNKVQKEPLNEEDVREIAEEVAGSNKGVSFVPVNPEDDTFIYWFYDSNGICTDESERGKKRTLKVQLDAVDVPEDNDIVKYEIIWKLKGESITEEVLLSSTMFKEISLDSEHRDYLNFELANNLTSFQISNSIVTCDIIKYEKTSEEEDWPENPTQTYSGKVPFSFLTEIQEPLLTFEIYSPVGDSGIYWLYGPYNIEKNGYPLIDNSQSTITRKLRPLMNGLPLNDNISIEYIMPIEAGQKYMYERVVQEDIPKNDFWFTIKDVYNSSYLTSISYNLTINGQKFSNKFQLTFGLASGYEVGYQLYDGSGVQVSGNFYNYGPNNELLDKVLSTKTFTLKPTLYGSAVTLDSTNYEASYYLNGKIITKDIDLSNTMYSLLEIDKDTGYLQFKIKEVYNQEQAANSLIECELLDKTTGQKYTGNFNIQFGLSRDGIGGGIGAKMYKKTASSTIYEETAFFKLDDDGYTYYIKPYVIYSNGETALLSDVKFEPFEDHADHFNVSETSQNGYYSLTSNLTSLGEITRAEYFTISGKIISPNVQNTYLMSFDFGIPCARDTLQQIKGVTTFQYQSSGIANWTSLDARITLNSYSDELNYFFEVENDNYTVSQVSDSTWIWEKVPGTYSKNNYTILIAKTSNKTGGSGTKTIEAVYPIIPTQNYYGIGLLNYWDGKQVIGEDYILTPMIGAGHKDLANKFSGVALGDLAQYQKQGGTETWLSGETGIYGFSEGEMTYALREDGTFYLGGDGIIQSIDYNEVNGVTKEGMQIDLKNKTIKAGKEGQELFELDIPEGLLKISSLTIQDPDRDPSKIISSIIQEYANIPNGETPTEKTQDKYDWFTQIPQVESGHAIWERITTNYLDNTTKKVEFYCIQNNQGISQQIVRLYQYGEPNVTPGLPENSLIYDFTTGKLKEGQTTNGWQETYPPTGIKDNDQTICYMIQAVAISNKTQDEIAVNEWTNPPVVYSGINSAKVQLFKRSTNVPTKEPSGDVTYNFLTGDLTIDNWNDWSKTIPSEETDQNPCWMIETYFISSENSVTINNYVWPNPVLYSSSYKTAIVQLYTRMPNQWGEDGFPLWRTPLTYDFKTKTLDQESISVIEANRWYTTLERADEKAKATTGTDPTDFYVTAANAYSASDTDVIPYTEWQKPVTLSRDGADGAKGADGLNQATIYLYQRVEPGTAFTKPADNTITYKFADGTLSGNLGNWSQTIPNYTANTYCYVTQAVAISAEATDVIDHWSDPEIYNKDGRGIKEVVEWYYATSSDASTPIWSSNWKNNISETGFSKINKFLWNCEEISYDDTSTSIKTPVSLIGTYGKGIDSVIEYYQLTNTDTSPKPLPTLTNPGKWETNPLKPTKDMQYLWNCEIIKYTDGTADGATAPALIGNFATAGGNTATILLYKRSGSTPTDKDKPKDGITYSFSQKKITSSGTLLNSWSTTVPTADGNPLYVTAATVFSISDTDTIATDEWSWPPTILTKDGEKGEKGDEGENGLNVATVVLYQRFSSTPTSSSIPTGNMKYYFANGNIQVNNTSSWSGDNLRNWSIEIPAATIGKDPCYRIQATAANTGDYDIIPNTEWTQTPIRVLVDGADGKDGTSGSQSAIVYLFSRTTTPIWQKDWQSKYTTPNWTSNITYNFNQKKLTTNLDKAATYNWYPSAPSGTDPLYMTYATALASVDNDTDEIAPAEWAAPQKYSGEDGINGINGINGIDGKTTMFVSLYKKSKSTTIATLGSQQQWYDYKSNKFVNNPSSAGQQSNLNGWSLAKPTRDGNAIFEIAQLFQEHSVNKEILIPSGAWPSAVLIDNYLVSQNNYYKSQAKGTSTPTLSDTTLSQWTTTMPDYSASNDIYTGVQFKWATGVNSYSTVVKDTTKAGLEASLANVQNDLANKKTYTYRDTTLGTLLMDNESKDSASYVIGLNSTSLIGYQNYNKGTSRTEWFNFYATLGSGTFNFGIPGKQVTIQDGKINAKYITADSLQALSAYMGDLTINGNLSGVLTSPNFIPNFDTTVYSAGDSDMYLSDPINLTQYSVKTKKAISTKTTLNLEYDPGVWHKNVRPILFWTQGNTNYQANKISDNDLIASGFTLNTTGLTGEWQIGCVLYDPDEPGTLKLFDFQTRHIKGQQDFPFATQLTEAFEAIPTSQTEYFSLKSNSLTFGNFVMVNYNNKRFTLNGHLTASKITSNGVLKGSSANITGTLKTNKLYVGGQKLRIRISPDEIIPNIAYTNFSINKKDIRFDYFPAMNMMHFHAYFHYDSNLNYNLLRDKVILQINNYKPVRNEALSTYVVGIENSQTKRWFSAIARTDGNIEAWIASRENEDYIDKLLSASIYVSGWWFTGA